MNAFLSSINLKNPSYFKSSIETGKKYEEEPEFPLKKKIGISLPKH